jgi:hypothetical protein
MNDVSSSGLPDRVQRVEASAAGRLLPLEDELVDGASEVHKMVLADVLLAEGRGFWRPV